MAALMGRFELQLMVLLSISTCVNTYARGRRHDLKLTKANVSKTSCETMEPVQGLRFISFVSIPTVLWGDGG